MFTKTLLPDTLRAIKLVSGFSEIKKAYLAGGTALALQLGHRISVDLDFFMQEEFDEAQISSSLSSLPGFTHEGTIKGTVWGRIGQTKFSLFHYSYPLLDQTIAFRGVSLAGLADIAAMKIHALEDGGTKRDFIDVYFLAQKYTLEEMLDFYQRKYSVLENHLYSILRALDYFEDAELETQMPRMIVDVNWDDVKGYFRKETLRLIEKKL